MKRQIPKNVDIIKDLALLLAKYTTSELTAAIEILDDPERLDELITLIEKAIQLTAKETASQKDPNIVSKKKSKMLTQDNDFRLSRIRDSRPGDSRLLDELLEIASSPWSKARVQRVDSLIRRYGVGSFSGRTVAQRRAQLIDLFEVAPRSVLEAIASEFRTPPEGGDLQEWSDIILRDRKPRK